MKKKLIMSIFIVMLALFGFTLKTNADTIRLGNKFDGLWHYKLNEYTNMNLYCAQEGGTLSHWYANTYNKNSWEYNSSTASVFKSETDYKKITWIKNHIWEQTDKNLYSYDEIYDILSTSGQSITMEDVETVYGSQNNKFKLYQLISWTYTNGRNVTASSYLSGSLLRVYNAITALADANYNNQTTEDTVTVTSKGDPTTSDNTITWDFTVSSSNSAAIINVQVLENGEDITSSRTSITESGNNMTVKVTGYDNTTSNAYQILFTRAQVIGTGTIYTHSTTQNMILISTTRVEDIVYEYKDTVEGIKGYLNVELLKKDDSGNLINGIGFEIAGNIETSGTTGSDGKYKFVNNKEIEESGTTYEYTITELENNNYVILKDPIKVKLTSGIKSSGTNKYYAITRATFSSGKTTETVELVNGREVTLKIESTSSYSEGSGGTSTVTITVENVKKRFDLALTKTITYVNYNFAESVKIYDSSSGGYSGQGNGEVALGIFAKRNQLEEQGYDNLKEMDTWEDEKFSSFITYLRANLVPILDEESLKANGVTKYNLFDILDANSDGIIDSVDASYQAVQDKSENDSTGVTRLNSVDSANLNKKDENGNIITTAEYNLNKKPVTITKEGTVKYEISVYNEGDIDAKEIEITDYIPAGLAVIDSDGNEVTNGTVTYKNNDVEYTWNITINADGTTTAVIKVLTQSGDSLEHYVEGDLESISVPIYCKVTTSTEVGNYYYNVAEITSASPTTSSDRDSETNSIDDSSVEELIDDYSSNYEDKISEDQTLDEDKIDKSVYDYEDDDDFEVIKVRARVLDLALRKSITKVGSSESNMEEVVYGTAKRDRLPYIDATSASYLLASGTGYYMHKKVAVDVETGDYVEYTIRVYNEGSTGDYAGFASQITDYLPNGLEFYAIVNQDNSWTELSSSNIAEQTDNTNGIGKFIATYDKGNNKIILNYVESDKNAIQPQDSLLQIYANQQTSKSQITYYTTDELTVIDSTLFSYQEVKIICKVTEGASEADEYLTNIAEITEEKYLTKGENKVACEENGVTDADSTPGTVSVGDEFNKENQVVDLSTYYEEDCNGGTGVYDEFIEYYEGLEDDDDFETVKIYKEPTIHKGIKDVTNQDSGYYDEVTGDTYNSAEEVESILHDWVIQTDISSNIANFSKYVVSDTIDTRLEFKGLDSVTVKIVDGEDLVEGTDYELNYDETTRVLTITFIDTEAGMNVSNSLVNNIGGKIEIRYNTTFAKDENGNIIGLNEAIENQATLTYNNGNTGEKTKVSETPEVHTGGIKILKYTTSAGEKVPLKGATFKIAKTLEDAEKENWLQNANGEDIVGVSDENGIVEFVGLEFGEDAISNESNLTNDSTTGASVYEYDYSTVSSTYYVVETIAPEGYVLNSTPLEVTLNKDSYDLEVSNMPSLENISKEYDLALRKFITKVDDTDVTDRIPQVDISALVDGTSTSATYTHTKEPVLVATNQVVTYTIRVYNEGLNDTYASLIKDDIPDGLEFISYTDGDGSINDTYGWKLVDENNNEVTDVSKATYIITDYLSKENETTEGEFVIKGFNSETMTELDYKEVKVQFKVTEPTTSDRILINYAQISEETDSSGNVVKDRDSTPNEWIDSDDDQDIEKVRVLYFDLALRKWVTQAIVTVDGVTTITETGHTAEDDPEEVVKVDLKKSKIDDVTVKFKYSIRITNEGEIAGYATEIRDDIPDGLMFVAEDNPDWREEDGKIVTNALETTLLQPGESAEVEIILTWVNSEDNMGVKINVAEINKDYNEYGTPDIDSTPGNNVEGEDDIDDAPVMLTVKTGAIEIIKYLALSLEVIVIITTGIILIKKKVLENPAL